MFDLQRCRGLLGRSPGKVLLAGPRAAKEAAAWNAGGSRTQVLERGADPRSAGEGWDAVIVDGALETERWDRWYLQRLHRVLAPGGVLRLSVPNLYDLWSPAGAFYLLSRIMRELRRKSTPRGVIPSADRSEFTGRRYRPEALAAMLGGLGFDVLECGTIGHGLPGFLERALGGWGPRTARRLTLTARKLPSLSGPDRAFPDPAKVLSDYRAQHAASLAARDSWVQRTGRHMAPQALEIADWARRGVLVISPHPDDEVIGAGGTLLDVVAEGGAVTVLQVTDGADSAAFIDEPEPLRREVRLDEAKRVATSLGARELICLRADNRALRPTLELEARFREVFERVRPGVVLLPSFTDIHPDHQTVLRLAAEAMRGMAAPPAEVALYEVWSSVAPTQVHDVTARISHIERLLLDYETALKVDDYVHLVAERLLYNSLEHRGRTGYLEGFEVLQVARFLELARSHFEPATVAARSFPG